jgi:hypothetical protein
MPGKIKAMIEAIVAERSQGSITLISTTRTKLLLKGINISSFTDTSPDDPAVITKLKEIAKELGVTSV